MRIGCKFDSIFYVLEKERSGVSKVYPATLDLVEPVTPQLALYANQLSYYILITFHSRYLDGKIRNCICKYSNLSL